MEQRRKVEPRRVSRLQLGLPQETQSFHLGIAAPINSSKQLCSTSWCSATTCPGTFYYHIFIGPQVEKGALVANNPTAIISFAASRTSASPTQASPEPVQRQVQVTGRYLDLSLQQISLPRLSPSGHAVSARSASRTSAHVNSYLSPNSNAAPVIATKTAPCPETARAHSKLDLTSDFPARTAATTSIAASPNRPLFRSQLNFHLDRCRSFSPCDHVAEKCLGAGYTRAHFLAHGGPTDGPV